jgi:hypothetical protein
MAPPDRQQNGLQQQVMFPAVAKNHAVLAGSCGGPPAAARSHLQPWSREVLREILRLIPDSPLLVLLGEPRAADT